MSSGSGGFAMAQTDRQTDRPTDRHGISVTKSVQRAKSLKITKFSFFWLKVI